LGRLAGSNLRALALFPSLVLPLLHDCAAFYSEIEFAKGGVRVESSQEVL